MLKKRRLVEMKFTKNSQRHVEANWVFFIFLIAMEISPILLLAY